MPEKPITFLTEPVSPDAKRSWALARWKRDGVASLPNGVSLLPHGRAASLYFRAGSRFMDLSCELSGDPSVDAIIYLDAGLSVWIDVDTFESVPATPEDQREALETIRNWLTTRPGKFVFYPESPDPGK